jgi:hypothetical protein
MADDFQAPEVEEEVSVRDDLAAAFQADAESQGAPPAPDAAVTEPKPAEAPVHPNTEPARDSAGKFAKTAEAGQTKVEPVKPQVGVEPLKEAIVPPASWSAAAKTKFATLDPDVQQEVLKRERDVTDGLAQRQQRDERFNRLDSLLAPRRERFQLAGLDEFQAVQALFAAQDFLERTPREGIAYLARQYGVDLRSFAQGVPAQTAQPPLHPAIQQLLTKVQTLESAQAQQQTAQHQAATSHFVSEVQSFRTDPKNLYFDNVADDMAVLLQSGRASTLQDAYDRAVWANPETRPLVQQSTEAAREADRQAAARAKAERARHASGSVTGSPTPGSSPTRGQSPTSSVADDLRDSFRELAG